VTGGGYDLATRAFTVAPSDGLRVLGARVLRGGKRARIVVEAQNPAPDPKTSIRWRPQAPRGGYALLRAGGRPWLARYSAGDGGWSVGLPFRFVRRSPTITVARLQDAAGNRTAGATEVKLGDVAKPTWPTNMGVGGGRTPGPFGQGTFPP
jgi:hypothetical protein